MDDDVAAALRPRAVDTALEHLPPQGRRSAAWNPWRTRAFALPSVVGSLNELAARGSKDGRHYTVALTPQAATEIFGTRASDGKRHAGLSQVKFAHLAVVHTMNTGPVPLAVSFNPVAKGNVYGETGARSAMHIMGGVDTSTHDIIVRKGGPVNTAVVAAPLYPGYKCNNLETKGVTRVDADHVIVAADHPVIGLAHNGFADSVKSGDTGMANAFAEILEGGRALGNKNYPMLRSTFEEAVKHAAAEMQADMDTHDLEAAPFSMVVSRADGLPFNSPLNVPGGAASLDRPMALHVRLAGEFAAGPTAFHDPANAKSAARTPVRAHANRRGAAAADE